MRVNYYFRNPGPFNYSIERVFKVLEGAFDSSIEIKRYYTEKPIDLLAIYRFWNLDADIHHITGAVNYLAFAFPPPRTILTVHDIRHYTETFQGIKKKLYGALFWSHPLRLAKHITAVSDFTKQQLIDNFQIDASKITVIPNPVDAIFTQRLHCKEQWPRKFVILQLGNSVNKNVEALVNAVGGLPVKLLLVRYPNDSLIELLRKHGVEYEFRPDLNDTELVNCYIESHLLYFASTYEGFGLPIIEAMTIGRPVITSRISPLQEVAGNASLLVDPHNVREIREAIVAVISSFEFYDELVCKGLANAKKYDPHLIASRYLDLYRSCGRIN